jgi:hypothetical protein
MTQLEPFSPEELGTRHRSMMRYCNAYPGSVGFVISQDGDIRAISKVKDILILWDGIRLTRNWTDRHPNESDPT